MKKIFLSLFMMLSTLSIMAGVEAKPITADDALANGTVVTLSVDGKYLYGSGAQNCAMGTPDDVVAEKNAVVGFKLEKEGDFYLFRAVTPAGGDYGLWGSNPCYLNSQPSNTGVTFILGKNQDIANGSCWTFESDGSLKCAANDGYFNGVNMSDTPVTVTLVELVGEADPEPEPEPVAFPASLNSFVENATIFTLKMGDQYLYGTDQQGIGIGDWETACSTANNANGYILEKNEDGYAFFRAVKTDGSNISAWGTNPCWLNAQPSVGGVIFNMGKDQDFKNGSTWIISQVEGGYTIQNLGNKGYLNGNGLSETPGVWELYNPDVQPDPEPVGPISQDIIEDLTRDMFHEWDSYGANGNIIGAGGCDYQIGVSTGMPFGNGSVIGAQYADLSEYDELRLTVTEGTPRLLLNRQDMGGSSSDFLEINNENNEYVKSVEDGVWVIDLVKITADKGYAHLNVIKGANWANVKITKMELVKKVIVNGYSLKDIKTKEGKNQYETIVLGAGEVKVENAFTNIRNWAGERFAPAKVSTNGGKLIITTEEALPAGDYRIYINPNTLALDGKTYEEALECILAIHGDDSKLDEAKELFDVECAEYEDYKESLILGVNLYQYLPATPAKIQALMDDASYYVNLLAEEEHIYETILKLRKEVKAIRPILPKTDKYYAIKHKESGLYLNISGDGVILSKEATPVQFHLTEPSDGMFNEKTNTWEQLAYTYHYSYIYTTPEQKYLGCVANGNTLTTTNRKNTIWRVKAQQHTNNYFIYAEDAYGERPLAPVKDVKEDAPVAFQVFDQNSNNKFTGVWFIEECDAPVIEEEEPSIAPEGYIAIKDEASLEGQTVILMNAETEEFIYGIDAQNIAVADLETATATTNAVTSYKIEKADNGYLFRCVTPNGADYGLWGANPCYFNAQPNVGGVTFNLGKDQDIANGSTWKLTYDEAAKAWTIQSVANEGYLAGTTISAELTAKWVICASTENSSSATPEATAISSVEAAANATEVYNAAGARVNGLQKGLNIVKLANGKVVKIMK